MIHDVVIAGAGPVGLFLACELRLRGVAVLVLERLKDPHTPLKSSAMGARGINLPSAEAFYRRGLLKPLRESSISWLAPGPRPGLQPANQQPKQIASPLPPRFAGHFAGIMLDGNKIDFSHEKYTLGGPSATGGMITLGAIEELLTERAQQLGVTLRYGSSRPSFTRSAIRRVVAKSVVGSPDSARNDASHPSSRHPTRRFG